MGVISNKYVCVYMSFLWFEALEMISNVSSSSLFFEFYFYFYKKMLEFEID